MKICPNCRSEVDDNYDICWCCQYSFTENRIIGKNEFTEKCPYCNADVNPELKYCPKCYHELGINNILTEITTNENNLKIDCLRCQISMISKGSLKFHDASQLGVFGGLFEIMPSIESFDVYFCPQCGKVEFYIPRDKKQEEK